MRGKPLLHLFLLGILIHTQILEARQAGSVGSEELPAGVASSPTRLRFHHLDQAHGLSQATAYTVFQDRQGFMWFGTQEGLDRYDGHRFQSYRRVPFDTTSLGPGWVTSILEDREGALWVGRTRGLSRFDRESGRFVHFNHDPEDSLSIGGNNIRALLEDRDGRIWIGTSDRGVSRLDPATGQTIQFQPDAADRHGLKASQVENFYLDSAGHVWVATYLGLYRFDEQTGRFESHLEELTEVIDGWIPQIRESSKGTSTTPTIRPAYPAARSTAWPRGPQSRESSGWARWEGG